MNIAILNRLKVLVARFEKAKTQAMRETIEAEIKWTQKLLDDVNNVNNQK